MSVDQAKEEVLGGVGEGEGVNVLRLGIVIRLVGLVSVLMIFLDLGFDRAVRSALGSNFRPFPGPSEDVVDVRCLESGPERLAKALAFQVVEVIGVWSRP